MSHLLKGTQLIILVQKLSFEVQTTSRSKKAILVMSEKIVTYGLLHISYAPLENIALPHSRKVQLYLNCTTHVLRLYEISFLITISFILFNIFCRVWEMSHLLKGTQLINLFQKLLFEVQEMSRRKKPSLVK